MINYIANGVTFSSDRRFDLPFLQHMFYTRPNFHNVTLHTVTQPLWNEDEWQSASLYAKGDYKNPRLEIRQSGDDYLYFVNTNEQFRLNLQQATISEYSPNSFDTLLLDLAFVEEALALYIGLHNKLTFHGACVTRDDKAILLLADSGGGKSSLTTQLIKNGGQLVSDDMVVIWENDVVYPSHSLIRLNRDSGKQLLSDNQYFELNPTNTRLKVATDVGQWSSIPPSTNQLVGIFVLDCNIDYTQPNLTSLTGVHALQAMLEGIYGIVNSQSIERVALLQAISKLVSRVPVHTFHYPRNYASLSASADFLIKWIGKN